MSISTQNSLYERTSWDVWFAFYSAFRHQLKHKKHQNYSQYYFVMILNIYIKNICYFPPLEFLDHLVSLLSVLWLGWSSLLGWLCFVYPRSPGLVVSVPKYTQEARPPYFLFHFLKSKSKAGTQKGLTGVFWKWSQRLPHISADVCVQSHDGPFQLGL